MFQTQQESTENNTVMQHGKDAAPVFVLVWAAPPVFAVVVIWASVTLTTQARRFLTELCLVVGQHIVVF